MFAYPIFDSSAYSPHFLPCASPLLNELPLADTWSHRHRVEHLESCSLGMSTLFVGWELTVTRSHPRSH